MIAYENKQHGNVKIDLATMQHACFTIHQRGERVTNLRLREELGGRGATTRISEVVRWFNQEGIHQINHAEQIEAALKLDEKPQVIASSGAITQIVAGLESALTGREQQLEAEFAERKQALERDYQERFAELEKQKSIIQSERQLMHNEIEHLRQMDAGKNRAIEEYVNQLRVLEQKRAQAKAQMHALIEKQNQKEADTIQLENDLAMERQRQSQLMTTISSALDEKYVDKIVLLESNIKLLEQRLKDANDSYESDTALWMNKYDAARTERDELKEKCSALREKYFKLEDEMRLNRSALTEQSLDNKALKQNQAEQKEVLQLLTTKDQKLKQLVKANKLLLRKVSQLVSK